MKTRNLSQADLNPTEPTPFYIKLTATATALIAAFLLYHTLSPLFL